MRPAADTPKGRPLRRCRGPVPGGRKAHGSKRKEGGGGDPATHTRVGIRGPGAAYPYTRGHKRGSRKRARPAPGRLHPRPRVHKHELGLKVGARTPTGRAIAATRPHPRLERAQHGPRPQDTHPRPSTGLTSSRAAGTPPSAPAPGPLARGAVPPRRSHPPNLRTERRAGEEARAERAARLRPGRHVRRLRFTGQGRGTARASASGPPGSGRSASSGRAGASCRLLHRHEAGAAHA